MSVSRSCRWPQLLLFGTLAVWAATTSGAEKTQFSSQYGGYRVSTDFTVDDKDHAVISLPVGARPGDLLSIRPLRYMLWMQRISTQGGKTFSLYERNSPALVFKPAGSAQIFLASDLAGARKRGPTPIDASSKEGGAFIAKFEGGSVVRMKLLRAATDNDAAATLH